MVFMLRLCLADVITVMGVELAAIGESELGIFVLLYFPDREPIVSLLIDSLACCC